MVLPGTYSASEPFWPVFSFNLAVLFAAAAASYHRFEKSPARLRSRLWRDDRASAAVMATMMPSGMPAALPE